MTATRRSRTAQSTGSSSHRSEGIIYLEYAMKASENNGTVKTVTTHYIDGAFVESHGREVMAIIRPTDGQLIAKVNLGDAEDTRRAIAAAKRAFATYST